MKKYINIVLLPFLLVFLLFLYSFSSKRNGNKKITKIAVEFKEGNNGFLTQETVNKLLIQNQEDIKIVPKSVLDLHSLEDKVLSNPFVEKATVFLTVNGLLKARIKQREPIARILNNTNSYYVDKHGIKVPLSGNYSARVLLVKGVKTEEDIQEITRLVNTILEDDFLKKEIVGIQKSDADEYVFDVRSGNYKIVFGELKNVRMKFKKLKAFYNKAFVDETIGDYQKINLKYHNQVVCTK